MADPRYLQTSLFTRRSADAAYLKEIESWEDWVFDGSEYRHDYDRAVSLYVHYGHAVVTFGDGTVADLQPGDAMTINAGSTAVWAITGPIRNSYIYHGAA